jgi:hypothetical protein
MTSFTSTRSTVRFTDTDGEVSFAASRPAVTFTAGYQSVSDSGGGVSESQVRSIVAEVPILFADWGLHHYDTDGASPTSELNPADDLTAWETGGGPAFWGVPTTGTWRLLIHDELDRTLTGIYTYNADAHTIVRASDADTTAKMHQRHVIAKTYRERSAGGVATNPAWRPINTTLVARDVDDAIGTAVWDCVESIDTETFNVVTSFLQTQFNERPGAHIASNLVTATAVDGTATNLDVLFPKTGCGETSVPTAADFTTVVTLPVATVVGLFGEVNVLIPYGTDKGLYTLKASGPWTEHETFGGDLVMVFGGTTTGQPGAWQGVNDRGDGAVDPTAAPTGWSPFSVTPAQLRARIIELVPELDIDAAQIASGTIDIARVPTGTTGSTVPFGNDSRFSDARTPTAHKTSHQDGGSDELALDASQTTSGTFDIARLPAFPPIQLQITGRYIRTADRGGAAAPTTNRVFYVPIWIETACTVDRIGVFHEATTGGASSVARMAIYTNSGNLPTTKVVEATIDLTTAAAFKAATISQSLTRGLHWLAVASQPTSGTPTYSWGPPRIMVGATDGTASGALFDSSTYSGTLPTTAAPSAVSTQPPIVYLRIA